MLEDSILETIKKQLGIDPSFKNFDPDMILTINAALNTLTQIGVGPDYGFVIHGPDDTWSSYLNDNALLEQVKLYIFLKVKTMFDPPTSSVVMDCYQNMIRALEWRLNVQEDHEKEVTEDGEPVPIEPDEPIESG